MAKFLILTHIYPPAIDGGSQILFHLANYLKKHHHPTLVITSDCSSTDDFINPRTPPLTPNLHPKILTLPVYRRVYYPLRLLQKLLSPLVRFSILAWLYHCLLLFQTGPVFKLVPLLRAICQARSFRPEFILVGPLPTTSLLYAHILRYFLSIFRVPPAIVVIPCFHHLDPAFLNPLLLSLLSRSGYLAALTDFERVFLSDRLSTEARIFTLGAGIPASLLVKSPPSFPANPRLLFLGNFAAHKGILTLLDAFKSVHARHPRSSLTLAGQPTLFYPQILSHLNALPPSVASRVNLLPRRYGPKLLTKLLDASTLLILPSLHESFGLVIIEAWARGKPVIVANIPAPSSLVTQAKGGLIFRPSDEIDLASAINRLISNPALTKKLGSAGLSFTQKHFTWDKIGQCLLSNLSLSP